MGPSQCIHIGDSIRSDIIPASMHGLITVLTRTGSERSGTKVEHVLGSLIEGERGVEHFGNSEGVENTKEERCGDGARRPPQFSASVDAECESIRDVPLTVER